MEFNEQYAYPAAFSQIWDMYRDPAFTRQRLEKAQLRDMHVTVDESGDTVTVTASGTVDPAIIPAQVQRFIRGDVSLDLQEKWQRSGDAAQGTMTVRVNGAPVRIDANCKLTSQGEQTGRQMIGELRVQVPLLGPRLEKEAIRLVPQLITAEQEAAAEYLKTK